MAAYLDSFRLEAQLDGLTWSALTADVLARPGLTVEYGIRGSGPTDRVAGIGTLQCTLRDNRLNGGGREGYYTPGSPYALAGFARGCPVRLFLTYDGEDYLKFSGRITEIRPDREKQVTAVEAADFFDIAANHDLMLLAPAENLRIDQVVPLILANMGLPPGAAEYFPGHDTFPYVFDTVREKTKALGEFQKVAASELGYIYLRYSREYGDVLVTEGRYTRSEQTGLTLIEKTAGESGHLLLEDGGTLLWENGAEEGRLSLNGDTFEARLNYQQDGAAVNPVRFFQFSHGADTYNQIRFTVYPRREDTGDAVLFSLNSALALAPGEVRENLIGYYRDPLGAATRVSGKNMVLPVAGTDYIFTANADGSGAVLTAGLAVTAEYGAEGIKYRLANNSGQAGYVVKLQARGRGVYIYDPVALLVEDTDSQARNGARGLTLDLKYQASIETAKGFADVYLNTYRQARTTLDSVTFVPNYAPELMLMFLQLEPGAKVRIDEAGAGLSGEYFLQGVRYTIVDRMLTATWVTKAAADDVPGSYWRLETAGASELGATTVLGY